MASTVVLLLVAIVTSMLSCQFVNTQYSVKDLKHGLEKLTTEVNSGAKVNADVKSNELNENEQASMRKHQDKLEKELLKDGFEDSVENTRVKSESAEDKDLEEFDEETADEIKDAFFSGLISGRRRRRRRISFPTRSFVSIFTRRRRRNPTTTTGFTPNGCSVPMGMNAPYKSTFTPACNKHDICYYYKQLSRLGCDNVFLNDMLKACRQRAGGSFFARFTLQPCYGSAFSYYSATRAGGSSHYGPGGR